MITCSSVIPDGTGTGSADWPIARISWASSGGTPGWSSRKSSSWSAVAPVDVATGRRMVATISVPGAGCPGWPPYSTSTPGPPRTVSVLPPTPCPASALNFSVPVTWGWTMMPRTGPMPCGSCAGTRPVSSVCAWA